ncbi:hypothetical protein LNW73_01220 [Streptomyces sp. RKAG337]|nr:hypothetical protein [Streptomyces sp. RKAG337]MCM2424522.1 hypothetical protein [Streptomyces sp. RKAG337]
MARTLWLRTEPLHAVVYFDAQCREMGRSLGLKGYWMGYFATRSAPLGRAQPSVVTAAFGVFAPGPVARALPASWDITTPSGHSTCGPNARPPPCGRSIRNWSDGRSG